MITAYPLQGHSESGIRGTAVCAASVDVGDLVYVSGDKTGVDYSVEKADVSTFVKMPVLAAVVAKLTATRAVIQFWGELDLWSGLTPGRMCFVGANAKPTQIPPAPALGGRAYLQVIGVAVDSDIIRFEPIAEMKVRVNG